MFFLRINNPKYELNCFFILEGIVCQSLIPRCDGQVFLAAEVLVPNDAIRNLIEEDKIHQIYSTMQTGQSTFHMYTMNQSLAELYLKRRISLSDAIGNSTKPQELEQIIAKAGSVRPQNLSRG